MCVIIKTVYRDCHLEEGEHDEYETKECKTGARFNRMVSNIACHAVSWPRIRTSWVTGDCPRCTSLLSPQSPSIESQDFAGWWDNETEAGYLTPASPDINHGNHFDAEEIPPNQAAYQTSYQHYDSDVPEVDQDGDLIMKDVGTTNETVKNNSGTRFKRLDDRNCLRVMVLRVSSGNVGAQSLKDY